MKKLFFISLAALTLVFCSKEEKVDKEPLKIISIEAPENGAYFQLGESIEISVETNLPLAENLRYEWRVNDTYLPENSPNIKINLSKRGEYHIIGYITKGIFRDSLSFTYYTVDGANNSKTKWISELLEYVPAPGQFINKGLGNMASAQTIVNQKGMISLGGYGGYVTFKFDHSVINGEGYDFVVLGNAFKGSSEPGIVMVSYDQNGNGVADDPWYELAGSEYHKESTIKNYALTYYKPTQTEKSENIRWTDNQGAEGVAPANPFHKQCYYPLFLPQGVPDMITFSGTILDYASPDQKKWIGELDWGYADNYSPLYTMVVNEDNDTRNSNKFDINWAVDSNGKPVKLYAIDFIKVYTGVNQHHDAFGEKSTEVCGAISLRR